MNHVRKNFFFITSICYSYSCTINDKIFVTGKIDNETDNII